MHQIRHLSEPKRLLLAWQSSRKGSSRRRWDVGELLRSSVAPDASVTFRYFDENVLAPAKEEGFQGHPAFGLRPGERSNDVLDTFMRRLPPRSRSDFSRYLETLRIDPNAEFTDFALLGASEAKLPSDGFSIIDPLDDLRGSRQMIIEAAGYRHLPDRPAASAGDKAAFVSDPENPADPQAIAIEIGGKKVGWVNRLQTKAFREWVGSNRVRAEVDRVNGTPDAPRLYLYVEVSENQTLENQTL